MLIAGGKGNRTGLCLCRRSRRSPRRVGRFGPRRSVAFPRRLRVHTKSGRPFFLLAHLAQKTLQVVSATINHAWATRYLHIPSNKAWWKGRVFCHDRIWPCLGFLVFPPHGLVGVRVDVRLCCTKGCWRRGCPHLLKSLNIEFEVFPQHCWLRS